MANDNNSATPTRQDDQKLFEFDSVKSFYENIKGIGADGLVINPKSIDSLRSYININSNKEHLDKDLKELIIGTIGNGKLSPSKTPQESRCHAFYRVIGFPVISKSKGIYNPGHDTVAGKKKITPAMKADIAADPLDGFFALSEERERYVSTFLKKFSNNQHIDSCVTALSGINIRDFIAPFKDPNALESMFNIENQGYDIKDDSIVGSNDVDLDEYVNSDSKTSEGFSTKRYHFIKPFAVDPRIDISVQVEKKVAVPFTLDHSNRIATTVPVADHTSQKIEVDPPLIEAIIIRRALEFDPSIKLTKLDKSTIDKILNIKEIKNEQLVKDITGAVYGVNQQQFFLQYLNIIRAMVGQLRAALNAIKVIQSRYYWLPIPSDTGPEDGCSVSDIIVDIFDSRNTLEDLQTEKDGELIFLYFQTAADDVLSSAISAAPNYAKKIMPLFFGANDADKNQLELLKKKRNKALTAANDQLQIVELIMGEFSGFGLADMIVIMGGLHLMPAQSLLGFLDEDAYDRAKKTEGLKIPDKNPTTINVALNDLTNNVRGLYNIMDDLIKGSS